MEKGQDVSSLSVYYRPEREVFILCSPSKIKTLVRNIQMHATIEEGGAPELLQRLLDDPDSFLTEAEKFNDYFLPLQNSYKIAAEKIDALQNQLKGLERMYTAQVQVIYSQIGVPPQGLGGGTAGGGGGGKNPNMTASGGVVHAAAGAFGKQAYYVGEIGPEIFVPSQDGRILSNHESKAAIRSGFGSMNEQPIVININTPINLADRVWVENELAPYIRKGVQDVMARG